ncbi:SMP-30/gluconolactonase/LRE family protein [Blastopirellula sp. JC732]|uniref:SMP-30/gluconolactonase/LRE family protein n=1 Tax=Blastopirellula sediminis TaxID=2894196 RepID=A0A9X1MP01_9BACT|nr:SMP-30/gluconolactonase/LRE family protein [Blastopirellula sediminis]MCC9606528.1 SMP-30/gluconolactonase/LRE family protein [Blastopirellula sediminis]MCC9630174.1 SMP-30/gluconolactonase/LRE family protein [Blastopirellula sediminis]
MSVTRRTVLALGMLALVSTPLFAETPKSIGKIERLDPAINKLIPADSVIEVLADGFDWSEGPVWVPQGEYALFSDIPPNRIMKWKEGEGISIFMEPSGYTGKAPFTGKEPGTNGLALNAKGELTACCHGDRNLVKFVDGKRVVLADKYDGKRFNSPNDLVIHSSGDIYFTDPPYGLPKNFDDPGREQDWCGVYRLKKDGTVDLVTSKQTRPNGVGLSPDEKTLYVAQSDPQAATITRYPLNADGSVGEGTVFYDGTSQVGKVKGLPDGMAVDATGNIWATGPGGVLVFTPEGKQIGLLNTGEATANCTFGADGYLYITADMYFCRVKTNVSGIKK